MVEMVIGNFGQESLEGLKHLKMCNLVKEEVEKLSLTEVRLSSANIRDMQTRRHRLQCLLQMVQGVSRGRQERLDQRHPAGCHQRRGQEAATGERTAQAIVG